MISEQQSRLMEQVASTMNPRKPFLPTQDEAGDAYACAVAGLLKMAGDGTVELTENGHRYVIALNTNTP